MNRSERLQYLQKTMGLSDDEILLIQDPSLILPFDIADRMVENVIGMLALPFGIATNFVINGKEYLVPMVTEEPSVIAGSK